MNLVRWNPWRDMSTLQHRINHVFNDPLFRSADDDELSLGTWYPAVDMFDEDDKIVIKAELPGMEKKDISVDIENRVLTLSGERNYDNEVKEENYYRRERATGRFKRVFNLPADVDSDQIKADFKDGVLKVEIPKPEEQKPKQITVH
ncbi:MAG: Hsp20/alpha crystallin family protein [Deltaproteobacteria bacterium]|nr:Hsp20/alpha crystallin family protein [Deltaproteobacteria bacterium]